MNTRKEIVNKLQQDILLWQGFKPEAVHNGHYLGLGAIESAFPNGVFPKRAIHEFITIGPEQSAASNGFIAGILSLLMQDGAACVWISTSRKLFPPALSLFNADPGRIIFMDVPREKDALWIMEEALRCDGLVAVVAELNELSLIESRRLQLAVEQSGTTGFILRKDAGKAASTVATARWEITPRPSETELNMPGIGYPRWNVALTKVRNGNPGNWTLEWAGDKFIEIPQPQEAVQWFEEAKRQMG